MSEKPIMHGRDHRPGGMDPIPFPVQVAYPQIFNLPLGIESNMGSDTAVTIDSTRRNNYKLEQTASSQTATWPFVLGDPTQDGQCALEVYASAAIGPAYGTITAYVAGAYASPVLGSISPGDWILIASVDMSKTPSNTSASATYFPELRRLENMGYAAGGEFGFANDPSVHEWGQLATGLGGISGTILTGAGPGYYFFRLDMTSYTEMSELVLINADY